MLSTFKGKVTPILLWDPFATCVNKQGISLSEVQSIAQLSQWDEDESALISRTYAALVMYAQRRALGLSQGLNQSQGVSPQNHSPGILLNKSQGIASQAEFPTSELGLAAFQETLSYLSLQDCLCELLYRMLACVSASPSPSPKTNDATTMATTTANDLLGESPLETVVSELPETISLRQYALGAASLLYDSPADRLSQLQLLVSNKPQSTTLLPDSTGSVGELTQLACALEELMCDLLGLKRTDLRMKAFGRLKKAVETELSQPELWKNPGYWNSLVESFTRETSPIQNGNNNVNDNSCILDPNSITDAKKSKHRNERLGGTPVHFLHPYFGLFLNLSLGIQLALEDAQLSQEELDGKFIRPGNLSQVKTYNLPTAPSLITAMVAPFLPKFCSTIAAVSNLQQNCVFKEYASNVFRHIRRKSGIEDCTYLDSLGIQSFLLKLFLQGRLDPYHHQNTPGKSVSEFFRTSDSRFLLKSISTSEFELLMQKLIAYCNHVTSDNRSLLMPILGIYSVSNTVHEVYFIAMSNLFSCAKVKEIYDVKGSNRTTPLKERKPGVALKDLDMDRQLILEQESFEIIWPAFERDLVFLKEMNVMDYSILVGVATSDRDDSAQDVRNHIFPAKNGTETYYLGFVDYLVPYSFSKKLENGFKCLAFDKDKVSVGDPTEYAKRLSAFTRPKFSVS